MAQNKPFVFCMKETGDESNFKIEMLLLMASVVNQLPKFLTNHRV
jgi:hypothetical protein